MIKNIITTISIILVSWLYLSIWANAEELTPTIDTDTHKNTEKLKDKSHITYLTFNENDTITILSDDGNALSSIYIVWNSPVESDWTLTTDNGNITCGKNRFIHEYIRLEQESESVTINIPCNSMKISDIRIFSKGELPSDVQVWNPPCSSADFLVISSHADDEILFLGGVLPIYSTKYDAAVQVLYMTEFWSTNPQREHEKLNGLWEAGIKYYPACANFKDIYTKDYEDACRKYNYTDAFESIVTFIRRFKPQVIVTHDTKGEYNNGYHILTCKAVMEAVEKSLDSNTLPESVNTYGVWDTPKTYIHLYPENKIKLDLRFPMEEFGGRTALQVCIDAYDKHVSQHIWPLYVSDSNGDSCADFGLWRTNVGLDTENNMLENIKTYKIQAEEFQAESIRLEEESKAESRRLEKESLSQAASIAESQSIEQSKKEALAVKEEKLPTENNRTKRTLLIICMVILLFTIPLVLTLVICNKNKKKKFSDK